MKTRTNATSKSSLTYELVKSTYAQVVPRALATIKPSFALIYPFLRLVRTLIAVYHIYEESG
jgi:hypothetical protein